MGKDISLYSIKSLELRLAEGKVVVHSLPVRSLTGPSEVIAKIVPLHRGVIIVCGRRLCIWVLRCV